MNLWCETSGDGSPILFLHSAVCDSRMWARQRDAFASSHTVLTCDLRGFGRTGMTTGEYSHCRDVLDMLDRLAVESFTVVGSSMGGRVALELALAAPDRVVGLVVVAAPLPGHQWSPRVVEFGEAEDAAFNVADVDAAVELNVSLWLDGPAGRRAQVSDETRQLVADMQRQSFELLLPYVDISDEKLALDDLAERLDDIAIPTLVAVGEHDVSDFKHLSELLASRIHGAELHVMADTAHLPSLERPDEFNRLLRQFLSRVE